MRLKNFLNSIKILEYKKSFNKDKVLAKYRKRYMSLASSVSHYGTDIAIQRFEKYKNMELLWKRNT